MTVNEPLILFNGRGGEYHCVIIRLQPRCVTIKIDKFHAINRESALRINLGQALVRNEKMDWLIQKSVELGVHTITPIISQHSRKKVDAEKQQKRLRHWQAIAIHACEQCGRNCIPKIHEPITLPCWLSDNQQNHGVVLHPAPEGSPAGKFSGSQGLSQLTILHRELGLLIGPEGGFTEQEIALAQSNGFTVCRLGPRILRAETAPIATISILQALHGDLG